MVHFLKIKKKFKKIIQTGKKSYIYKKDLHKACFQRDMADDEYKYLSKRTVVVVKLVVLSLCQINKLQKLIIRTLKKTKVTFSFKDNIWGADLPDMQLLQRNYIYIMSD